QRGATAIRDSRSTAEKSNRRAMNDGNVEKENDEPADEVPHERHGVIQRVVLVEMLEHTGGYARKNDGEERHDGHDARQQRKNQDFFILRQYLKRLSENKVAASKHRRP